MNFFVLIYTFLMLLFPCFAQQKQSDSIVAIVNDEIITYGDVEAKVKDILTAIENSPLTLREKEFQKQKILQRTLQSLVDEKLTLQEAKRYNISINESTIKDRVEEELKNKESDLTAGEVDFNELMRARLTLQELFQKKSSYSGGEQFRATIDTFVPPLEIREYYEKNIKDFTKQNKIKIRTILLFYSKYGGKEQTLEKAKMIVKQLREGADFSELAKEYSNGPYSKEGGTWPRLLKDGEEVWDFLGKGDALHKEVETIAFSLKEGEISEPIPMEIDPWCQIIKIEAIQHGGITPFSQAQESIRQKLRTEKILVALLQMRTRLREKAFIWPSNLFDEQ